MSLPKLQKIALTSTIQVPKKVVITQTVEKTITTYKNVILHKDVEYKDKKYVVAYCPFNDTEDYLFVIDYDQKDRVINKKWHYRSGGYIGNTHTTEDGIVKQLYLHNFVMNKLTFEGKGQHHSIDHINRIGRDNRHENLRTLSQTLQNINQSKRERTVELPPDCGINPQDIPKNITYRKADEHHGDRFLIDIKLSTERLRWQSTSSKNIDLQTKLQHAILKLKEYNTTNKELIEINKSINNIKQRNDLIKSFNVILMKSGFPQEIIDKNLGILEDEDETEVIEDQEAQDLAKQLIDQGYKNITSSLPLNCGVTPDMIPKYCYYKPAKDKRGDKFIIERHPKLTEKGVRQWATTESKTKTTKEKFDLLIEKYKELEK